MVHFVIVLHFLLNFFLCFISVVPKMLKWVFVYILCTLHIMCWHFSEGLPPGKVRHVPGQSPGKAGARVQLGRDSGRSVLVRPGGWGPRHHGDHVRHQPAQCPSGLAHRPDTQRTDPTTPTQKQDDDPMGSKVNFTERSVGHARIWI